LEVEEEVALGVQTVLSKILQLQWRNVKNLMDVEEKVVADQSWGSLPSVG